MLASLPLLAPAQSVDLTYYLPALNYNPAIPTPASVLGFQVGEQHAEAGQIAAYYRALAEASPRVTLVEYGQTYERRPLFLLTITSEENQRNIEQLKTEHLQRVDPTTNHEASPDDPVVVWMGYSVHGNEPSGANAALLVAYYLAAAPDAEVSRLLANSIILMDPFINPDGLNRFATWVNTRKGQVLSTDPNNIEQNEQWPRGRTNHYWFDLNRDWLLQQHPESRGRLKKFHEWKPNVVTDHHEMGSNSTFFFMPGIPSRNNPLTPDNVFQLTRALGKYHAAGLDSIGSLYFTEESYDDFYYGKGSTYPDVNGAVGILFEQASARSHAQETDHGVLTFPFAIRNQVVVSFTTMKGALALRSELLQHQREFYRTALEEAQGDPIQAYVFGSQEDPALTYHMAEVLRRHQIKLYRPEQAVQANNYIFSPEGSYLVPIQQPQYRLIKALFERRTSFEDSLFYDVSAWTFPLAYNLPFAELSDRQFSLGSPVDSLSFPEGELIGGKSDYAYLFEMNGYYAHRALYRLLAAGVNVKVSSEATQVTDKSLEAGTILVSLGIQQSVSADSVYRLMQQIVAEDGITVYNAGSGLVAGGIDLGSRQFSRVPKPEVALLIEGGVSSYDAGEVWHLLDQRFRMPLTMLSLERFNGADLARYNTLVMVDGSYNDISKSTVEKLKQWVQQGNTLVAAQGAGKWLADQGIGGFQYVSTSEDSVGARPYASRDEYRGAQVIGGAIFEAQLDRTHPVGYGFHQDTIPIFRNSDQMIQRSKNPYAYPLMYTESPLLAGYISEEKEALLGNTAAIGVTKLGQGTVIVFTDNPNFRAYWYGTNKLFLNSVFFGAIVE